MEQLSKHGLEQITATTLPELSGDLLSEFVKREAQRIEIKTYFGQVPSCHTLRRTPATVNADRLGMKLNPHEIAQRLRCGIDVAYKHYVQDNVLLRSIKADEQRKQLANDPHEEAQQHLRALEMLGIAGSVLEAARTQIEQRFAPRPAPTNATWTLEDTALPKLEKQWDRKVSARMLRRHLTKLAASPGVEVEALLPRRCTKSDRTAPAPAIPARGRPFDPAVRRGGPASDANIGSWLSPLCGS